GDLELNAFSTKICLAGQRRNVALGPNFQFNVLVLSNRLLMAKVCIYNFSKFARLADEEHRWNNLYTLRSKTFRIRCALKFDCVVCHSSPERPQTPLQSAAT